MSQHWARVRGSGTFRFSDVATPDPYAALMTHLGRWHHVERTPPASRPTSGPASRRKGAVAGPDITADATGLTRFATVRRADEPG